MPFSGYQDLDPAFAEALQALVAENAGIVPFSGYRSIQRQKELWEASDKSGHRVARPGRSQHNFGRAVDLKYLDDAAREFAHANAKRFGLVFPMSWEPWHIEPIGARGGPHASAPADQAPDRAADTPMTDAWSQAMTPLSGLPAGPEDASVAAYQRPLPFTSGYGWQDFMQAGIGGTLRQDLRAGIFHKIAGLFGV